MHLSTLKFASRALSASLCGCVFSFSAYAANITLVNQGLELTYPISVRLEQALNDTHKVLGYSPYALGAVLTNPSKQNDVIELKQQVFSQLDDLASAESTELKTQLSTLNYVAREFIHLDLDWVRVKPKHDPLLNGTYQLRIGKMPTTFQVMGLLPKPQSIDLKGNVHLGSYLEPLEHFKAGDINHPYLIQPDGNVIEANLSYWHNERYYPAPGALVFIGYKNNPELNQQIAQLLRHAVKN
ncbi:capsule biosynthesis GfcC D2 domain-containing protein [Vibrio tapetis]|uniref:Uncharacterized protein n=1 Tax=Vibrio tapetis subsp. tapetis TaxID=1671868 RepID=A0A2N8ZGJ3_9VIBR|nr:capsule biosynthesis GfcC D2 domain-containing protein [Vibrio tapetis]SON51023.1 conserved exported protein of unknown function [Vibrio tapetis subsp. tapetis]